MDTGNMNNNYPTIHVINLPERTDRLIAFDKEATSQGIKSYKRWLGIKAQFSFNGIRQSHQKIVQFAKDADLPFVTIAEDDVCFLGPGAFDYYISRIPDDYDIYLGGIFDGEILPDNTVKNGDFSGLTLYTVHQRFYDTFLSIRNVGHLDRLLKGMGKYVVCNPIIVSQHSGWSDNHNKIYTNYNDRLKGRKLWNG